MSFFPQVLGPVHTNPVSNDNGVVLLRFQKDLRPHLSFSYRFPPSTLKRRIRFENAVKLDASALQYLSLQYWRKIEATW